jgi:hypothetical protein
MRRYKSRRGGYRRGRTYRRGKMNTLAKITPRNEISNLGPLGRNFPPTMNTVLHWSTSYAMLNNNL